MAVAYISRPTKITIAVTTQPTNTEYMQGDTLDLTDIVVTATQKDGTTEVVTSSCTFSPANGSTLSTSGTQTITISYRGATTTTTVTAYAIDRIAVTTAPTKTAYNVGDTINYNGIVVKAYANNDNIVRTVTSQCTFSPASGTTLSSTGSFSATITWRSKTTTQSYSVTAKIYGAEWAGGSSSAWTRTDDAANFSNPSPAVNNGNGSSPFDNIMPWSGMERVVEGGQSQVLVKIPKFYYKWTRTGSKMKLQISMYKGSGFLTSPAHANRGDGKGERDYVYVGAYHCANVSSSSSFHYRSLSGRTPITNITRATARSSIHSYVGTAYWQWDFAMYMTIVMLYLVEYADWNSQAKIGYGRGSFEATGKTDTMTYHTGSNTSRSAYGHTRYRYIEDLWGNCCDWCDGIYIKNDYIYTIDNPANFSDTSNGTLDRNVGLSIGTGYVTNVIISSGWVMFPSSYSTTDYPNNYICDQTNYLTNSGVVAVGADGTNNQKGGLFLITVAPTTYSANVAGCRLMKLP